MSTPQISLRVFGDIQMNIKKNKAKPYISKSRKFTKFLNFVNKLTSFMRLVVWILGELPFYFYSRLYYGKTKIP